MRFHTTVLSILFFVLLKAMEMPISEESYSEGSEEAHLLFLEEKARGFTPGTERRLHSILCSAAALGHEADFFAMLSRNHGSEFLLDCRTQFKSPLEMALLRGHFDTARKILALMKEHLKYVKVSDLLFTPVEFLPFAMIVRDKIDAVRFLAEAMGDEAIAGTFKADWGMATMAGVAHVMTKRDILHMLVSEFKCVNPYAPSASSASLQPSNSGGTLETHSRRSSPRCVIESSSTSSGSISHGIFSRRSFDHHHEKDTSEVHESSSHGSTASKRRNSLTQSFENLHIGGMLSKSHCKKGSNHPDTVEKK